VLEAARALVEIVVVSPPGGPDGPPGIELTGNLVDMLLAGGVNTATGGAAFGSCLSAMLSGSRRSELGEKFPSPSRLQSSRRIARVSATTGSSPAMTMSNAAVEASASRSSEARL